MDIDEMYEMKRSKELEIEEAFFIWYYSIPDGYTARTNYKIGDKYVIELSFIDKTCDIKVEIDRKLYDIVDQFVTTHDENTYEYDDIVHYIIKNYTRKEDK